MTRPPNLEPSPDAIIRDLHRVREAIVDSYGGDLHALTADARERQRRSGRPVWRGAALEQPSRGREQSVTSAEAGLHGTR